MYHVRLSQGILNSLADYHKVNNNNSSQLTRNFICETIMIQEINSPLMALIYAPAMT